MAKLVLSMDGLVLKEIPLHKERLTIGRKPSNDIQIDNLAISGEHAVIVTILADSFLEDLNSTNGTLVNGQPVKKHFLHNNDVIELGKYKLKYMSDQQADEAASDFERNAAIRSGVLRVPPEPPFSAAAHTRSSVGQPAAPAIPAAIQLLNGPHAGKELELTKTLTTLGKPGVQVAVIARRPNGYYITHVEGRQFPVVNGQALDTQAHLLHDHDIIEIAGVKMEFFHKG